MDNPIPIFPLNLVLFPNTDLPLHIFEDRYKQMVQYCTNYTQPVGIILIKDGNEVGNYATPYSIGTFGHITSTSHNTDGTIEIIIRGQEKFKIEELLYDKPYLSARVEKITHVFNAPDVSSLEEVQHTIKNLNKVIDESYGGWASSYFTESDPQSLIYQGINLVLQNLSVPNNIKQNLLESESFERQAKLLLPILNESIKLFEAETNKNNPYPGFSKN